MDVSNCEVQRGTRRIYVLLLRLGILRLGLETKSGVLMAMIFVQLTETGGKY